MSVVVYLNGLGGRFIGDAGVMILGNRALLDSREWLVWFRRDFYWGTLAQDASLYRPLTVLSFLVHVRTTGALPFAFLAGNVLLHAAVSVLVLRLGNRLVGRLPALVGALIFAVHPLHTEAVVWVMGRSELLAAFFALAACLAYLRSADPKERHPRSFAVVAASAYLAALFSKEHVALLPLWFGLAWLLDRPQRSRARTVHLAIGSAAALALFLFLRAQALTRDVKPLVSQFNPAALVPAPTRWVTAVGVVGRYAGLFVWPANLSHDYSHAQIPVSTGIGGFEAAGFLVILALLGGFVLAARRAPGLALTLALAPITFVIVSNFPFPILTIMAERVTYLPSVGLCLTVGWLVTRLPLPSALCRWVDGEVQDARSACSAPDPFAAPGEESPRRTRAGGAESWTWALAGVLAVVTVALAARTMIRNRDWKDVYTFAVATWRASPRSAWAQASLAMAERARRNHARAFELIQESVRTNPDNPRAFLALGGIQMDRGEFRAAVEAYEKALKLVPNNVRVRSELGPALVRAGREVEGEQILREAIQLDPRSFDPRFALGDVLLDARRYGEALEQFREVVRMNPKSPRGLYGLALASSGLGDREAAETYGRQAAAAGFRVPPAFWQSLGVTPP